MDFIVGTFNTSDLFILHFIPPTASRQASLSIVRSLPAIGYHSWLALSKQKHGSTKRFLYATAWTEPPSIAAYSVDARARDIQFLNAMHTRARSGYVCVSDTHVYSVGGPSGEVFKLADDGCIGQLVQELSFADVTPASSSAVKAPVAHGDFGGLRHGSHSVDLSPDGRSLYVADIGRNAIFAYSINQAGSGPPLVLGEKHISPRSNDGPRHTYPHPGGKILYSLQEHSSMVDLFSVAEDGTSLSHMYGVKIIPEDKDSGDYWADEVRTSTPGHLAEAPAYLYASTRGLHAHTLGYVAVFALNADGTLKSSNAIHIWTTPTSGGIANAIEPAPPQEATPQGIDYLALTDSEEGWVFVLSFDGSTINEVARVGLGRIEDGTVVQAATAVWL